MGLSSFQQVYPLVYFGISMLFPYRIQQNAEDLVEATRQGEIGNQNSIIRHLALSKCLHVCRLKDAIGSGRILNPQGSMLEDRDADGKHVRYGALYGHVLNSVEVKF